MGLEKITGAMKNALRRYRKDEMQAPGLQIALAELHTLIQTLPRTDHSVDTATLDLIQRQVDSLVSGLEEDSYPEDTQEAIIAQKSLEKGRDTLHNLTVLLTRLQTNTNDNAHRIRRLRAEAREILNTLDSLWQGSASGAALRVRSNSIKMREARERNKKKKERLIIKLKK